MHADSPVARILEPKFSQLGFDVLVATVGPAFLPPRALGLCAAAPLLDSPLRREASFQGVLPFPEDQVEGLRD